MARLLFLTLLNVASIIELLLRPNNHFSHRSIFLTLPPLICALARRMPSKWQRELFCAKTILPTDVRKLTGRQVLVGALQYLGAASLLSGISFCSWLVLRHQQNLPCLFVGIFSFLSAALCVGLATYLSVVAFGKWLLACL